MLGGARIWASVMSWVTDAMVASFFEALTLSISDLIEAFYSMAKMKGRLREFNCGKSSEELNAQSMQELQAG